MEESLFLLPGDCTGFYWRTNIHGSLSDVAYVSVDAVRLYGRERRGTWRPTTSRIALLRIKDWILQYSILLCTVNPNYHCGVQYPTSTGVITYHSQQSSLCTYFVRSVPTVFPP